jgi:hypothetical protein
MGKFENLQPELFDRAGPNVELTPALRAQPVNSRNSEALPVVWRLPAYNTVHNFLTNPVYAGAYVFGRTKSTVSVVDRQSVAFFFHSLPNSFRMREARHIKPALGVAFDGRQARTAAMVPWLRHVVNGRCDLIVSNEPL